MCCWDVLPARRRTLSLERGSCTPAVATPWPIHFSKTLTRIDYTDAEIDIFLAAGVIEEPEPL
jgi:hypothetical protein